MEINQEAMIEELAKDFGAIGNVSCEEGIADLVSDDEVHIIDQVNNWEAASEKALKFAACMSKHPSIILTGTTSAEMVDLIEDKVWDRGISLRFTQYCTLSDVVDVFGISENDARRITKIIAERHELEHERSGDIFKYIDEIWELV